MRYLLLAALLVTFGGCAVATGTSRPEPTAASSRPAIAPAGRVARPAVAPPAPDRVLAARVSALDEQPVRLEIRQLERAGSTTSLGLRLTTTSGYGARLGRSFDDGVLQAIRSSGSRENGSSIDGVYLIDRMHGTKYLVARDADNRCICDTGLQATRLTALAPLNLSATYGAPPASVRAVDVVVPLFGTFPNVPLG